VHFVFLFRPTCVAVFLATRGGVLIELLGALTLLDALGCSRVLRWRGASMKLASTMPPSRAMMPLASSIWPEGPKSLRLP
jgi:hypothetical protein